MNIIITDRWGNEIKEPDQATLEKTINDVFIDKTLPEISITNGDYYLDIINTGWVYLSEENGDMYYMKNAKEDTIRQLWEYFYTDQLDYLFAETWIKGIPAFNGDYQG
jgi:hypothetical protein